MSAWIDGKWKGLSRENLYQALKNRPCKDCGNVFPAECMDFDHLPGLEKKFNISQKFFTGDFDEVLEEIEKCDLVCANCHRVRTKTRGQQKPNRYAATNLHWSHWDITPGERDDIIRFHSRVTKVK